MYGPNGQSRGIANVVFSNTTSAVKAVSELNGVKVDGRPMKVCRPTDCLADLTKPGGGHRRRQGRTGCEEAGRPHYVSIFFELAYSNGEQPAQEPGLEAEAGY